MYEKQIYLGPEYVEASMMGEWAVDYDASISRPFFVCGPDGRCGHGNTIKEALRMAVNSRPIEKIKVGA